MVLNISRITSFMNQLDAEEEKIFALLKGLLQMKGCISDVVDAAKLLRSETEVSFENSESILKDGRTEKLMHLLQVKSFELDIHCP